MGSRWIINLSLQWMIVAICLPPILKVTAFYTLQLLGHLSITLAITVQRQVNSTYLLVLLSMAKVVFGSQMKGMVGSCTLPYLASRLLQIEITFEVFFSFWVFLFFSSSITARH